MAYGRILVGTDGSDTAGKAVERAAALAEATGATLTIASAGDAAYAEKVLDEAVARCRGGASVDTKVLSGDPATALIDEAEANGYDLLVVGNKGMTGATRFFLGSVPNKVSHHAPTGLLIVHTTG